MKSGQKRSGQPIWCFYGPLDLAGLYILYNLAKDIEIENIRLYRVDGLLVRKDFNGLNWIHENYPQRIQN